MILNPTFRKVMEVLLDHPNIGYSKTDLAEQAGISRSALYDLWPTLEDHGIVREKRRYGGTVLYRLDPEADLVDEIARLVDAEGEGSATGSVHA
jgi:DNA-binding transcriptional ArsR family regulator